MKNRSLFWLVGLTTACTLSTLGACGGDDATPVGGAGNAGEGGEGGSGTSGTASGSGGTVSSGGVASGDGGTSSSDGGTSSSGDGGMSNAAGGSDGDGGASDGAGGDGAAGMPPTGDGGDGGGGGDTERVAICSSYCTHFLEICGAADANTYENLDDCNGVCLEASWAIGLTDAGTGNSINCRISHTNLASGFDPGSQAESWNTHCGHASENPPNTCVDV
ncbi:MAG TPA: hypothetical protein VF989_13820 [Polyangiaceae bacterium]